ncbi:hypothetical protein [Qipengyuania sediminis]|uniref:hypothetical protein n=1 Tax=Qipengyuania sediminis TaxID=1532023 RepID=UPI00105A6659|nr:hypothetical protein [Qipengyuania sediminis]
MVEITDPAEEFALVCKALANSTNATGADWLASQFDVDAWSKEFYLILFAIIERGHYLIEFVEDLPSAAHISDQVRSNIEGLLQGFRLEHLSGSWQSYGAPHLTAANVSPILVLSAIIRPHVSYPRLSDEERETLLTEVGTLTDWLEEHQLQEQDFIRQALIEGLIHFHFRLKRVRWLGYGFALESLKEVIGAYMALERSYVDDGSMPMVGALLQKVSEGLKRIYDIAGVAKETTDRADFLLKAYGAASLYAHANAGGVAGLLTFGG